MDMDEVAAAGLSFPSKNILLNDVRLVFTAAEKAIGPIDETQFAALGQPQPITEGIFNTGETLDNPAFGHLLYDMLHFGMMQNLAGQHSNKTETMQQDLSGNWFKDRPADWEKNQMNESVKRSSLMQSASLIYK